MCFRNIEYWNARFWWCFYIFRVSMLFFALILGKQCMGLVDLDRAWAAEERNYSVQVISMEPESCSPKNNMFVGIPT